MRLTSTVLSIAALASAGLAQSPTVTIPRLAENFEGNDIASYPFGRSGFRTQQIIEEPAIATVGGIILGIEYRPDTGNSIGSQATTIQNVTISMSQTTQTPALMSTTFANNVTGTPMVVYQGSVTLPAYTSTPGSVAPWVNIPLQMPFAFTAGMGNLLIDITAADSNSMRTNWIPDSALPGGAVDIYGSSGALSQQDSVRTTIAGNGSMGRFSGIVPGGQFTISVQSQFFVWSGSLMIGFDRMPRPLALGRFGAPGNFLFINPIDSYPYTLQQPPIGFGYRFSWTLNVPNDPNLTEASLHLQPFVLDPAANALGLATMNAVQVTIGDSALHPVRQVNSSDYTAASGNHQYVSGIHGGAVVRLNGSFQ